MSRFLVNKKTLLFVLLSIVIVVAWNANVYIKELQLYDLSEDFQKTCKTTSGCVTNPSGWLPDSEGAYTKNMMRYVATKDKFEIRWHIATDVWLIAKGGKSQLVSVERVIE